MVLDAGVVPAVVGLFGQAVQRAVPWRDPPVQQGALWAQTEECLGHEVVVVRPRLAQPRAARSGWARLATLLRHMQGIQCRETWVTLTAQMECWWPDGAVACGSRSMRGATA